MPNGNNAPIAEWMNGPEVAPRLSQLVGCFLIFLMLNLYIVLYFMNYELYRRVIIEQRSGLELGTMLSLG